MKSCLRKKLYLPFLTISFLLLFAGIIRTITFIYSSNPALYTKLVPPVAAQTTNVDWPQFMHDAQHTGRTTAEVPPNYGFSWAWIDKTHIIKNFVSQPGANIISKSTYPQFTIAFSQTVQPIIADGKTFMGAMNGTLYAIDALTGNTVWEYTTKGPILGSVAYANGIVVTPSMDGNVYGLNSQTGSKVWQVTTGAGINASPVITGNTAFIGSRDGKMYAINISNGSLAWSPYVTRDPANATSPYAQAPIVAPAAISEDGQTLLFGAENMYFYGLDSNNGTEHWTPQKLIGQSFLDSWPVVKGDKVIIRTMSSLQGAEYNMESVLDSLPACTNATCWANEKTAILNYLSQNPGDKTMYVLNISTGQEPYLVAMGRVSGNNWPPFSPVVDSQNRLLSYWRSRSATFIVDSLSGCFGTKYCPDISGLDLTTGNRIFLNNTAAEKLAPELDNGFALTVGGNYLYFQSHFRGTHAINLTNGTLTRLSHHSAKWDGGDFRGWGFKIIYYGNDSEPAATYTNDKPVDLYDNNSANIGLSIATINGSSRLFINEGLAGFIASIKQI